MFARTQITKCLAAASVLVLLWITPGQAAKTSGQKVDAGTFSVLMNGKRVATETFSITQDANGSVVNSEFHGEGDSAAQSSTLELTAAGELKKYEWKELSPGKAQETVTPDDKFLMERFSANPGDKQQEQPFILPSSTSILDDYVFVHREVLAWKYLATGCRQTKGFTECALNQRSLFGTLNPHQRASMPVSVEYAGREKISVHGVDQELIRINLKSDAGDWALWLDDQYKVRRMSIPAENTEILRD